MSCMLDGSTVGQRRQTEICIRESEILMIQSIEELPPELEVSLLVQVELLGERRIDVPESRRA